MVETLTVFLYYTPILKAYIINIYNSINNNITLCHVIILKAYIINIYNSINNNSSNAKKKTVNYVSMIMYVIILLLQMY
jgi:hypothetical protein